MRVTVQIGTHKLVVPCGDGSRTIGWLQSEIIRRWDARQTTEKAADHLRILELKNVSNAVLDLDDQIVEVLSHCDTVVVIRKTQSDQVRVGDMFAHRYYVTSLVGDGTFGRVFVANDLELSRPIALKVLKRSRANRLNTKRFLREARLTAHLGSHPNIVTLYDSGRTDAGDMFLVMELLRGQSMAHMLDDHIHQNRPISQQTCKDIFVPLLNGLHYAHSQEPPIIHRDLKPDNVFLVETGSSSKLRFKPVLMDFGISVVSDSSQHTSPCGTRMYSSPEQTRTGHLVDCRTDIWAIGVMLYQCVTLLHNVPFDPVELLLKPDKHIPHVKNHTRSLISDTFADIIHKALQIDPENRFQSALELRQALEQSHNPEPQLQQLQSRL